MKKTFVKVCAAALAVFAVSSCFDDSLIWDEFDSVNADIETLESRLDSLENAINSQISTINSSINTISTALTKVQGDVETLTADLKAAGVDITALETAVAANKTAIEANGTADAATLKTITEALEAAKKELADKIAAGDEAQAADLAELLEDLTALEAELDAAVATIAVVKVEEKDGNVVLTLANGKTINVSTPLSNVDNAGLITTVEVEGVKYWAVVGKDGTVTSLNVPVGHPTELAFDIDKESGELLYSVDGGDNWIETGVVVDGVSGFSNIITDFDCPEEGAGDYVVITVGEVEYVLPLYGNNAELLVKAGKTIFEPGETQEIELQFEGLTEFYVMSKPDGWKASVSGKVLTVTAPVKENTYAEQEGQVLIHANDIDGKCKIAKLAVYVNNGEFVVSLVDSMFTVINAKIETTYNWFGEASTDFEGFYFGLANIDDFNEDPQAYVEDKINDNDYYDDISFNWYNMQFAKHYNLEEYEDWEGNIVPVCKVDTTTISLQEMYRQRIYEEMPLGEHYAVWVAKVDLDEATYTMTLRADELYYFYYEPVIAEVKQLEASHNDVEVELSLYGADSYVVGYINEAEYAEYGNTFDEYFKGMYWQYINAGWAENLGTVLESGVDTLNVSALIPDETEAAKLNPGATYKVFVLPMNEDKPLDEYVYETDLAPYVYSVKTNALVEGGAATIAITEGASTFSSIKATVAVTGEFETVYYGWYDADELADMTEAEIVADLVSYGYQSVDDEVDATKSVTAGEEAESYTLVAFASDATGKYGKVATKALKAVAVPYTTDYAVTLASSVYDAEAETYTVTFNVTGAATKLMVHASAGAPRLQSGNYYASTFDNYILNGTTSYLYSVDVTDGKAVVVYGKYNTNKWANVVAYTTDANGNYTALTKAVAIDVVTPATTPAE